MSSNANNKRGYNAQEAMAYLGVKRKAFNKFFRPHLIPVKFGTSIIFDVVDLNAVMDEYKRGNERLIQKGEVIWAENKVVSIETTVTDGVSIKSLKALDFESVLTSLKKHKIG